MRSHSHFSARSIKQHGFSMLEVLITLVIVAIALLGTAGLQVYAMRVNQGSQFRTQAVFLASDIAERMEANKAAAVLGAYQVASTSAVSSSTFECSQAACNAADLAVWDIREWEQTIFGLLPQPNWQICIDANSDNACDATPVVTNPITYSIIVSWIDRRTNTTYSTAGTGERFSYTATRTIGN